ncbi:hypothetical protein Afil01_13050 [Actinorhabdospora filicis]|uniref:Ricin B lectin domain-containing protein n=1 Tax=Actinorhabdospora filicis TaxID=1785913 RepID=A0A9W6SI99_9ACTN|nr:hypothetical protein [Actinorhabdospora filicis]GLZ76498.1 hypothetical protein Afil01_13050 [Actinorhabdospora filicis]
MSRARPLVLAVALLATALIAGAAGVYIGRTWRGARAEAAPPPTATAAEDPASSGGYPKDGVYLLRAEHSEMCLSVGPLRGDEGRAVLVQQPCAAAWPPVEITERESKPGVFTFALVYGDNWRDCLTVDAGHRLTGVDCAQNHRTFRLSSDDGGRFQISVPENDECLAIGGSSALRGAAAEAARCDERSAAQRFRFIPA